MMIFGTAASSQEEVSSEVVQEKDDSYQEIWNFSLSGHDPTGTKRWEVNGDTADVFSDAKIGLTGVKATSFSPEGSFTLNSKKGTFDKVENNIELKEEVVVQSSDGTTFKSDYLDYQAETGEIKTDAFVEIEQKQMRTFGYGAKADPEEKRLQLEKNVTVIANPSTTITCKGPLEINYKDQIAVFQNDVRVVDPRGEIVSNRMEVFFNKELETIQKVIATGNVRITQGENVTQSDRAEYDVQEGKVTLSQQPQLQVVPQ